MKVRLSVFLGVLACTTPVVAQRTSVETPKGIESVAAFGGTIWEKRTGDGTPGVVVERSVLATWGDLERVDLPAGTALGILRNKKLKACQRKDVAHLGMTGMAYWSNCLFDLDDDGKFDRVSYRDAGFSQKLDPPVPYKRQVVSLEGQGTTSTRTTLLLAGANSSELRLSYREFINDMARPSFTEDLTIPLFGPLPQTISVKDLKLTVLKIDGTGLRYQLD